jgi:HlyD family secretion protein
LAIWQNELTNYQTQLIQLNQTLTDIRKELEKYILLAPASGNIQNLSGIEHGSLVFTGQNIAVLTPVSDLIAETYVSTLDIGMLYVGQKVKFRIDAYDANIWGFVEGTVKEIANDVMLDSEGKLTGFRVICELSTNQLQYKDKKVYIKKGMTFSANFILMQRTLAQLLYENLSDWFNPNIKPPDDN